jgi:hypothetical protein
VLELSTPCVEDCDGVVPDDIWRLGLMLGIMLGIMLELVLLTVLKLVLELELGSVFRLLSPLGCN